MCRRKAHCSVSAASASATRNGTAGTVPGASRVGARTFLVTALPPEASLSVTAAGATTRRTIGAVLNGRRRGRRLRGERLNAAVRRTSPRASLLPRKHGSRSPLLSRSTWAEVEPCRPRGRVVRADTPYNSQTHPQTSHKGS